MKKDLIREWARLCGQQTYLTGKPCVRGSIAPRWVSNGNCTCQPCKDARSALTRARYLRKAEQIKAERKEYYRRNASDACDKNREKRRNDPVLRAKQVEACRQWRELNPGRINEINRARIAADPERHRAANRVRYALNPHCAKEKARRRELAKSHRTVDFDQEFNTFVMREAFHLSKLRQAATGIEWNVDHLIPLRGRCASGLHWAYNLQVIPAYLNRLKANRMIMTEPFEWLWYSYVTRQG